MKLTTEGKIMVAGHRGEVYNRCENTMASFREAIECGCDMIIANGDTPAHLYDILEGRPVGTLFTEERL